MERQWDEDMFQLGWQMFALMPAMDMMGAKSLGEYLDMMDGLDSPLLAVLRFLNKPTEENKNRATEAVYGAKENFVETRKIVAAMSKRRSAMASN